MIVNEVPEVFDPEKTLIFCDLDGVIADYMQGFQMALWDIYGVYLEAHFCTEHDIMDPAFEIAQASRVPPQSREQFEVLMSRATSWNAQFFVNLLPKQPLWQKMVNWPGQVVFITTRHPHQTRVTMAWLVRYGLMDYDPSSKRRLILSNDKPKVIKGYVDNLMEIPYEDYQFVFIDDKLDTVVNVAELNLPRLTVCVPSRTYTKFRTGHPEWAAIEKTNTPVCLAEDQEIAIKMSLE